MALESYQYQWGANDDGLEFRDQSRGGTIKDVYKNGQKIGAYNLETGHQYGLADTDTPMGLGIQSAYDVGGVDTGTLVKSNQEIVNKQDTESKRDPFSPVQVSPNNNVGSKSDLTVSIEPGGIAERIKNNQDVVNSGSPDSNVNNTTKGYYIPKSTQDALSKINPDAPYLSYGEQLADSVNNIGRIVQGKPYIPDPYIDPTK